METEFITCQDIANAEQVIEKHGGIINNVWDCLSDHPGDYHPEDTPLSAIKSAAMGQNYYDARELSEAYQLMANIARAVADMTQVELPI